MSPQVLTLKLDGITAGDYLAWCRDPDPPALGFALRSVHVDADPLGDTITATLDWTKSPPPPPAAATAAGLPLLPDTQVHPSPAWAAAAIDRLSVEEHDSVIALERPPDTRLTGHQTIARNRPRETPDDHENPGRTQVKHELALALTDLGGATFALAYHGALNDDRLAPRVQRIHDLYTQLDALDYPTHTNQQTNEHLTAVAA